MRTRVASNLSPWLSQCEPGDIHTVAEGNSDCVYVCTYEAGTPDSGRIRKYAVADTADRIELQADENTDWTGFQRIRSLWFKEL